MCTGVQPQLPPGHAPNVVNPMISILRVLGHVCCSICRIHVYVYLVLMETRGQDTFITNSVIVVAIKLAGYDTNEK